MLGGGLLVGGFDAEDGQGDFGEESGGGVEVQAMDLGVGDLVFAFAAPAGGEEDDAMFAFVGGEVGIGAWGFGGDGEFEFGFAGAGVVDGDGEEGRGFFGVGGHLRFRFRFRLGFRLLGWRNSKASRWLRIQSQNERLLGISWGRIASEAGSENLASFQAQSLTLLSGSGECSMWNGILTPHWRGVRIASLLLLGLLLLGLGRFFDRVGAGAGIFAWAGWILGFFFFGGGFFGFGLLGLRLDVFRRFGAQFRGVHGFFIFGHFRSFLWGFRFRFRG